MVKESKIQLQAQKLQRTYNNSWCPEDPENCNREVQTGL